MAQLFERIGRGQRLVHVMQERRGLAQRNADCVPLLLDLRGQERGDVRNRRAMREMPVGRIQ